MLSKIWNTLLYYPVLNVLLVFYSITGGSLGLAVMLLAVLSRLILLPSTKKQLEMTGKMAEMKPRLEKIQKKYKNNKDKLSKEQMKLYKEVGYNPIGCVGSFIPQLIIPIAVIGVIRSITGDDGADFSGVYEFVKNFFFDGSMPDQLNTQFLIWDLSSSYTGLAKEYGYFAVQTLPYLLLGIGVGIIQFISTQFMQLMQGTGSQPKTDKKKGKKKDEPMVPEDMQAQMGKSMKYTFPLMAMFFTWGAPAVLGVYWLTQSVMIFFQYFIIDRKKATNGLKSAVDKTKNLVNKVLKKN